ncbi:MAG: ion transporter [Bacteroidales bacterium]|nr:ion transporter [Bacteroidales bacterium]
MNQRTQQTIQKGRELMRKAIDAIGVVMHRMLFDCLLPKKYRDLSKRDIHTIIFRSDTPAGKRFDIWILVLIALNIVLLMVDSMMGNTTLTGGAERKPFSYWLMKVLEWGFTILFTFEFYLRIYCLKNPRKYIVSFYGIIDILSIFPAYLSLFFPGAQALTVLRLLRVLRIFRIFRMRVFLNETRFLINALRRSAVRILIFMLVVVIVAVILGTLIFAIEGKHNPAISSIPRGIYWAIVTITTVGYGDIAPVTSMGQLISTIVMLLGYAIIAVPTGIVAGETIREGRERHNESFSMDNEDLEPAEEPGDEDASSAPKTP